MKNDGVEADIDVDKIKEKVRKNREEIKEAAIKLLAELAENKRARKG